MGLQKKSGQQILKLEANKNSNGFITLKIDLDKVFEKVLFDVNYYIKTDY